MQINKGLLGDNNTENEFELYRKYGFVKKLKHPVNSNLQESF